MIIRDVSFISPEENIFYDQMLLKSAEDGVSEEALRFWEARQYFIVLGKISRAKDDINLEKAIKDDIGIMRRPSGGGAVMQGPGCLNYSFILSYDRDPALQDIRISYEFILGRLSKALRKAGVKAKFEPIADMAVDGKKFSGNAQVRKKRYVLHHGTILHNFPIDMIEKYLTMPKDEPPYRKGRGHSDFLTNIKADPWDIKQAISSAFEG